MVNVTLDRMAEGGIYDHLGGGFARYSTDAKWLVPHFEKMLYDNALLVLTYLEASQSTNNTKYSKVAAETLDYVLRDMTSPQGGFYAAEDADSEGEEGIFYVWNWQELKQVLDQDEFLAISQVFDISEAGNFEGGANILSLRPGIDEKTLTSPALKSAKEKLFGLRSQRIRPHRDEKIITSWNGLMIAAMARASWVLNDKRYLEGAQKAAEFVRSYLMNDKGHLLRRHCDGQSDFTGYLSDYAYLIHGLIELFQASANEEWLDLANALQTAQQELFSSDDGGLWFSSKEQTDLIQRMTDTEDGALPSAVFVSALNLYKLADINANSELRQQADQLFRVYAGKIVQYPAMYAQALIARDYGQRQSRQLVVVGDGCELQPFLRQHFLPGLIWVRASEKKQYKTPFLAQKTKLDDQVTYYLCKFGSCQQPTANLSETKKILVTTS
jgi:uncharacterized protein YyaL (SSP411 family)